MEWNGMEWNGMEYGIWHSILERIETNFCVNT